MRNVSETLQYILKRLLLMIFTFIVIFIVCFILIRLLPISSQSSPGTDAEIFYIKQVAQGKMVRLSDGRYVKAPIFEQLLKFVKNLIAPAKFESLGETLTVSRWGYAWYLADGIAPDVLLIKRLPPTILINVYSIIISVPLGLILGTYMALKKNKWQDHFLSVVVMLFISVPSFVYAFLLQSVLGYKLGWFDPPMVADFNGSWFTPEMIKSMVLPVIAMSFGSIAGYSRYTRAELTEVLTSDFMLLARTKGLSRTQATVRHAFRNSLVPIFPMILGEIISVLSGSVIIESIFAVNGVGDMFIKSINMQDYDAFQFISIFYIAIGLVGGLVVDVSYGLVDPRIRMGGGKSNG